MGTPLMSPRRNGGTSLRIRAFAAGPFSRGEKVKVTITVENTGSNKAIGVQPTISIMDSGGYYVMYITSTDTSDSVISPSGPWDPTDISANGSHDFEATFRIPSDAATGAGSYTVGVDCENAEHASDSGTFNIEVGGTSVDVSTAFSSV